MSTEKRIPSGELQLPGLKVLLSLSADSQKLFAEIQTAEDFAGLPESEFFALFANVDQGAIHREILKDLYSALAPNQKTEARRIAKGKPPTDGRDGKLLLLVKPFKGDFKAGELERVDAKYIRAFDNIEPGVAVARVYAPTPPIPGRSPLGAALPAKEGKPIKFTIDTNTIEQKKENGFEVLHAKIAGYLSEANNKLSVEKVLKVNGDVGYKTGDIEYVGGLLITADVKKDFQVVARGDITVQGSVLSGILVSSEGAINVKGGIVGELMATVTASSSSSAFAINSAKFARATNIYAKTGITANSLEAISVECGGDIVVEKEIRSAKLHSRGAVRIPKGTIIGGKVEVICGVEAGTLGNTAGATTEIHLISDVESSEEYREVALKIDKHALAEKSLELLLGPFAQQPARIQTLREPQKGKMNKLFSDLKRLRAGREELQLQLNTLLSGARFNRLLRVNFLKVLHPGVIITVGKKRFSTDVALAGPKTIDYLPEEEKFVIKDLDALQCDLA